MHVIFPKPRTLLSDMLYLMHVVIPKPRTLLGDMLYLMHVVIPKPRTLLGDMHWPRLACDATMQHQWTN
ncbi:hypothetical protein ACVMIX_003174 [Rhizobium leguminosarum]